MFNITANQKDPNQSQDVISRPTSVTEGKDWQHQLLVRTWDNWNLRHWEGLGEPVWRNIWQWLIKRNILILIPLHELALHE